MDEPRDTTDAIATGSTTVTTTAATSPKLLGIRNIAIPDTAGSVLMAHMSKQKPKKRSSLPRRPWSEQEDCTLRTLVMSEQGPAWPKIASKIPGRTSKQCRERWCYHLDPKVNKAEWTPEEDAILDAAVAELGTAWTLIAKKLNGRTDSAIKNRYYSRIRKRERARHRASSCDWTPKRSKIEVHSADGANGGSYVVSPGIHSAPPRRPISWSVPAPLAPSSPYLASESPLSSASPLSTVSPLAISSPHGADSPLIGTIGPFPALAKHESLTTPIPPTPPTPTPPTPPSPSGRHSKAPSSTPTPRSHPASPVKTRISDSLVHVPQHVPQHVPLHVTPTSSGEPMSSSSSTKPKLPLPPVHVPSIPPVHVPSIPPAPPGTSYHSTRPKHEGSPPIVPLEAQVGPQGCHFTSSDTQPRPIPIPVVPVPQHPGTGVVLPQAPPVPDRVMPTMPIPLPLPIALGSSAGTPMRATKRRKKFRAPRNSIRPLVPLAPAPPALSSAAVRFTRTQSQHSTRGMRRGGSRSRRTPASRSMSTTSPGEPMSVSSSLHPPRCILPVAVTPLAVADGDSGGPSGGHSTPGEGRGGASVSLFSDSPSVDSPTAELHKIEEPVDFEMKGINMTSVSGDHGYDLGWTPFAPTSLEDAELHEPEFLDPPPQSSKPMDVVADCM